MDITISLRVYRTVTATNYDAAIEAAEEDVDRYDVAEAIRENGWDDIDWNGSSAEPV